MYDWNVFNWTTLESYLTPVAARGHHAIFRFYLDFPGTTLKPTDAIPEFLVNGLKFNHYTQPAVGLAPDFFNETLIAACVQFIHALGAQYDGDPRIAVIEDGLLGHWYSFCFRKFNLFTVFYYFFFQGANGIWLLM